MEVIREILKISSFKPDSGNQHLLYELIVDTSLDKETIERKFGKPPGQFRSTYKALKDNLLDGLLQNSYSGLSKIHQVHITIRKKYLEAFILLQSGKIRSGITIAEEVFRLAEKYGVLSVALEMSRQLSSRFAYLKQVKYLKYKEKVVRLQRLYLEEIKVQQLFSEFNYLIGNNREWQHLLPEINALKLLLPNNSEYRFRLYYYSILNYVFSLEGNIPALIKNSEDGIKFFDTIEVILPHTIKWGFLIDTIPLFIFTKQYGKAEKVAKEALSFPPIGSFNWHLTQQYSAIIGFYSGKPAIANRSFKVAEDKIKKPNSPLIEARWKIIHAYLALYEKKGKITGIPAFRLYRLLNDVSALNKSETKRNVFILELLHLLAREKHFAYLNRTDGIEQYLSRNAKSKEDNRLRYFLRMLKCISTGGFHTIRVEAHAKKNKAKLVNTPVTNDFNILEKEIVPYELLWELALSFLKK